ncbi:MAG: hypothetical protein QOC80_20 [Frankiaceae bacterium]|jgi:hypothetical protein|nr:hypothetical protein [Frankiaceae bacterium]
MTRRVFYLAFGATVGILAVRRVSAAAEQWQPDNLVHRLTIAFEDFLADVRESMTEREEELRTSLGLDGSHDVVDAPSL